eukprot:1267402-Pyramimonas_sp.AAC.1
MGQHMSHQLLFPLSGSLGQGESFSLERPPNVLNDCIHLFSAQSGLLGPLGFTGQDLSWSFGLDKSSLILHSLDEKA